MKKIITIKHVISVLLLTCQSYACKPADFGVPKSNRGNHNVVDQDRLDSVQHSDLICEEDCFDVVLSSEEQEAYYLVNDHRTDYGLSNFVLHQALVEIARSHSMSMALGDLELGHDGFEERVEDILCHFHYDSYLAAENVGYAGLDNGAEKAVENWLDSEGHRSNIEGPYQLSGIGAYQTQNQVFFTQIFLSINP